MRRVSFNVRFCYRRKRGCWKKFAFLVITTVFNTCNAIDHTFYIHKESGLIINNVSVCTRHSLNVSCVYTTTLDFELIRIQNGIQISRGLDFLNYTDACLHHRTKRQRTFSVNRTARYFGADIDGDSNTATGQWREWRHVVFSTLVHASLPKSTAAVRTSSTEVAVRKSNSSTVSVPRSRTAAMYRRFLAKDRVVTYPRWPVSNSGSESNNPHFIGFTVSFRPSQLVSSQAINGTLCRSQGWI